MTFDSTAEKDAAPAFAALGAIRCNSPFDITFEDKLGETFTACPDFYHEQFGMYLEYKPCDLNTTTSKKSARNALAAKVKKAAYDHREVSTYDKISSSWSNSLYKHAIVQKELNHYNFVVVLQKPPTLKDAENFAKRGLTWCTLASLPSYMAFAHFHNRGISAGFTQHAKGYTVTVH